MWQRLQNRIDVGESGGENIQVGLIQGFFTSSQLVGNYGAALFVQAHRQKDLCSSIYVGLLLPRLGKTLNVKWFQADCS